MSSFLNAAQVQVVKASAGSGKTYALAKRYVQILLATSLKTPQSLKHILAITFTNKAAVQMKERIIALVKLTALNQMSDSQVDDILKPIDMTREQASKAAHVVMEDMIRHYHYFNVSTIDSFMNSLLAGCAFKMNLSARFKIKRNAKDYLLLSLDALIDKASQNADIRVLFERFITQYLFLENRGNWFPKQDLMGVLLLLFKQQNTYQRKLVKFNVSDKDIILLKVRFIGMVQDFIPQLTESIDKRFINAMQDFKAQHERGFDVDQLSRYFGRINIPYKKNAKESPHLCKHWETMQALLSQIVLCEAYAVFNPYVDLFDQVMVILEKMQVKEDILFLEQLNKKAGELFLDDLVSVAEVYYRLATRFNHYLIDEFQDTAQAQWQNIKPLVEEALSSGGSLFYVGDKKQAIYGFRGGKSRLFDQLPQELDKAEVRHDTLKMNYRSQRVIVDFNNDIFSEDNLMRMLADLQTQDMFTSKEIGFTQDDKASINDIFHDAKQISKNESMRGLVLVEIVQGKSKEERDEATKVKVIAAVQEARTRFPLSKIALLTRNNQEVECVTGWLMANDIAVQSERTSDIKGHWLIVQLMAYFRFLHEPTDQTAFVDFIVSELFLKNVRIPHVKMEAFLFEHRYDRKTTLDSMMIQFEKMYPHEWKIYFSQNLDHVGVYPLYELALHICQIFKCLHYFPETQGFIMHWLELIKHAEEDGCDLTTFLEYFDTLEDQTRFVPMPFMEAVQVLTIHKSKGLEFECVIIPFLEMTIKVGTKDKDGGQSFLWDETPEGLRLFRLKENYTLFCRELKERYAYEYKESLKQELNNMYVALTRAITEMVIIVPERVGNSFNPAMLLIPENMHHKGKPAEMVSVDKHTHKTLLLPQASFKDWVIGWQEELAIPSIYNLERKKHGEIIHFCLAQIKSTRAQDLKTIVKVAVKAACDIYKFKESQEYYETQLIALMQDKTWVKFFDLPLNVQIFCEQEIINSHGDSKRIDRVIIFENNVWAVDFKPQGQVKHYQDQIDAYKILLQNVYPKHNIEGFILTYDF